MPDQAPQTTSAPEIVIAFLDALMSEELDRALEMVADDIAYTNVPFPPVRGRRRVERLLRPGLGRVGFKVHNHHVAVDAEDDGVVITDRIDALVIGPVHWQFWVYGRFEVRDGRITVWRDSFDWLDLAVGLLRGVVGAVVPGIARQWPST